MLYLYRKSEAGLRETQGFRLQEERVYLKHGLG